MLGYSYLCDRCNDKKLSLFEYIKNWRVGRGRYCNKCWSWIHLKTGTCKTCHTVYTLRTYNKTEHKICDCGNELWLI